MNQNNDKQFTQTTFEQFLNSHNSSRKTDEVEFQKLFLSLDKKMHLYHSNGYAISSFRIQDIVVYQMINNVVKYYMMLILRNGYRRVTIKKS